MKNFTKFAVLAILAVSATAASAAELEFHGYSRIGWGYNTAGGTQVAFANSARSKFRLGNEADVDLEPEFTYSFTKLEDKSVWGVHLMPAVYRRMNSPNDPYHAQSDGGLPVSYKEYYFYGRNVPQLGGGEIWIGRRYFGRNYLGAINDQFLEAQDGMGAGVYDIPVGAAKLHFDLSTTHTNDSGFGDNGNHGGTDIDRDLSVGTHVTNIATLNKDSTLQVWARVYMPMQKTSGTPKAVKRSTGFSASAMHVAGFGTAGTVTVAARFDQNASTDQQDLGSSGHRNFEANVLYGLNVPSARTSVDAQFMIHNSKVVDDGDNKAPAGTKATTEWIIGFRTDTQLSGPFRFLFEAGYVSDDKNSQANGKAAHLVKVTPAFAVSGGNDPWSRPTFRLFYTYASWNKDNTLLYGTFKGAGLGDAFPQGQKTSGGSYGLQAEGWW